MCRATSSRNANITLARWVTEVSYQLVNALDAACTAASTSDGSASSACAWTCPVAGVQVGAVRVEAPVYAPPPIQCSTTVMARRLRVGGARDGCACPRRRVSS